LLAGFQPLELIVIASDNILWKLLWDYDPNGLIAVDSEMTICVVNPAFCEMFHVTRDEIIGKPVSVVLKNSEELAHRWQGQSVLAPIDLEYHDLGLYVRQVLFKVEEPKILGCIMVNLTEEWRNRQELARVRRETISNIDQVVTNQMKVAQQIASLLGETVAESKSSLLKLIDVIQLGSSAE
jgi:PAS domain-containing protein